MGSPRETCSGTVGPQAQRTAMYMSTNALFPIGAPCPMTNAGHVTGQNTWDLFTASPTWRAGTSPARCSMGCGAVGRLAIDDCTAFLHNAACAQAKIDLRIPLLFSFS